MTWIVADGNTFPMPSELVPPQGLERYLSYCDAIAVLVKGEELDGADATEAFVELSNAIYLMRRYGKGAI